jgi:hypothetical protein
VGRLATTSLFGLTTTIGGCPVFQAGGMIDLEVADVEEIATALADQADYDHRWLLDPRTGGILFWTGRCREEERSDAQEPAP